MSANNYLLISKSKFTVKHLDADTNDGNVVGRGKSLVEVIEIAEKFTKEVESEGSYVEYGIHFEK